TGLAEAVIRFVAPVVRPFDLPADAQVTVPTSAVVLASRQPGYGFSSGLTFVRDSDLGTMPRTVVEHVLSAAAKVEQDFANGDFIRPGGSFAQVVLRDANASGIMYSIWFATPVAFAAGNNSFGGAVPWSSFF